MNTITLVYVSQAMHLMTNAELRDLLAFARKRNQYLNITGMLLYKDGFFIQALEGIPEHITQVYNSIKEDPRHENVTLIYSEPIKERAFSEWSMGFNILDDINLKYMDGFTDFLANPSYEFFTSNVSETKNLLLEFRGQSVF